VVYAGDTFDIRTEDGYDHYTHIIADPFSQDFNKMTGIYAALAYSKDGKKYQKVERLAPSEIAKIKSKAQQKYIWDEWFFERAQTAAIKRIAKRQFQTIMGIQQAVEYDNRLNYDMSKTLPPPSAGSIIDNLNAKIAPQDDVKAIESVNPVHIEMDTAPEKVEVVSDVCAACHGRGIVEDEEGKGPCPRCQN
jgi:recombinational DNA repair protein RecT